MLFFSFLLSRRAASDQSQWLFDGFFFFLGLYRGSYDNGCLCSIPAKRRDQRRPLATRATRILISFSSDLFSSLRFSFKESLFPILCVFSGSPPFQKFFPFFWLPLLADDLGETP